jgi:hypothetical protein
MPTLPVDSEWGTTDARFEFACGCIFRRVSRSFRGLLQFRLSTDPCPEHQKENQHGAPEAPAA